MSIEGSQLPNVVLYEDKPENKVNSKELFSGKKAVLLGIVGAYTPVCSTSHLPGFIQNIDKFRQKGYNEFVLVTVNDPYVTGSWKKETQAEGKFRILSDPMAEFAKKLGMEINLPLLGLRSKRYTMLIDDNVVKKVFVEPDGTGGTVTLAENVLKNI